MFTHRMALRFLVLMIAVPLVMTGCLGKKQPEDTKAPVIEEKLGIVDMDKMVKSHPRYSEYQSLQLQINAVNYQIAAHSESAVPDIKNPPSEFQEAETAKGLNANRAVEIDSKLAKKQNELQNQLDKRKSEAEKDAQAKMQAYKQELSKEYMLPMFNLDIKRRASLSQSEAAAVNDEIERLTKEQQQKLAAKEAALNSQKDETIAAEEEKFQSQMTAYLENLDKELAAAQKDQQVANSSLAALPAADLDSSDKANLTNALTLLQQKQVALEQQILADIQNKTGQIAVEKGLDTVITNIRVNIQAIDITDLVIAGLKK